MPTPELPSNHLRSSKPVAAMTPDERRRAIAAILARGIRRLFEGCAAVTDGEEASPALGPSEDAKRPISGGAS